MQIIIAAQVTFILLIMGVYKGIYLVYPLLISLTVFCYVGVKKGNSLKEVAYMTYNGAMKSLNILKIFLLIGSITAIWMACGTVAGIVYYGVQFIHANLFIFSVFIICSLVSFLIGTAFGTAGTVGVAFMVMATSGSINPYITAGAIFSGAYFGDRCSPMSSSANLVEQLTETDIYMNIKDMFKTGAMPLVITLMLYLILSVNMPLKFTDNKMSDDIVQLFNISLVVLIPAAIILVFSIFKVNIKISMGFSILSAIVIAVWVQGQTAMSCINYMIYGYESSIDLPLSKAMRGGGIISMIKTYLIVFVSSAISGIVEEANLLQIFKKKEIVCKNRYNTFKDLLGSSIVACIFGCSQVLAVMLTHMLNKKNYNQEKVNKYELAVDLENTAIVISAIIPWNIAFLVPATTLGTDYRAIPYAFYLFLVPLCHCVILKIKQIR